ncbi:MAG TPA: tol-pal system protein YbgF [Stellaceae bacterium]|nr:tol-pal system protein YbgF [Stellaceae bacterium]
MLRSWLGFSVSLGLRPWSHAWSHVGAVLVVALAPAMAGAQDVNTQERLDRLERDLSMLQRQVYRGAPAMVAPGGGGGSTTAADVEIRMERLEAQMRDLTGRVEQVSNGLEQLRQRLEQINSDFDVRMSQGGGPAASGPPPKNPGKFALDSPPPGRNPVPPGTVVPPPAGDAGGGGLNPIFNTLSPPGTAPPRPSAPEPAGAPPPASGSVNQQFNHAFGLVKQADYANAEIALRAFMEAHPNDPLAGNAQYWLGQTYYARNRYQEAASAFAEGYKRYPKGPKAAEDLLYLSMSLAKADQKKNACLALGQLEQAFPNASGAVKERARAERKRLACG